MIQQSYSWAHIQKKTVIRKDTCIALFKAALFTIAKTWKQPKYQSIEERTQKMWCVYIPEHRRPVASKRLARFGSPEGFQDPQRHAGRSFNFMAAVTICSDFGAQKLKSATVSTVSPSICHEMMGPYAIILVL